MLIPVDWLREYVAVPTDATGEQIAADLVRVGLEEEGLHTGGVTGPLVVGRVLTKEPEPQKNGKTINWCTVDVGESNGTGEPQGIVCGAHNFEPGDLVVVILPGGVISTPHGPLEVSARKTYGHVSAGMICSERELGIGDDHDGILVLTRKFADDDALISSLRPGMDAIPLLGLDRETVEVNVTPDRGYCFAIRGIAREYSHATRATFIDPAIALAAKAPEPTDEGIAVELRDDSPIRDRVGCDRYVARVVRGIDVSAPTPRWMATRLTEAGMRPISLPVDVTNYVMLGLGQPLHAFDLDTLEAPIVVRRARDGERLKTLDDQDRALDTGDLLITDRGGERPVAIAGVMGGAETEVGAGTRDVLIEAAHFEAVTIARTARRHKLPSEASRRFERGVDPALAAAAAQLAVDLLVEHGGGTVDPEVTDVGSPTPPAAITMSVGFPTRIVGVEYSDGQVVDVLESVGCDVTRNGDLLSVTPPTWRPDLTTAEDLVEEVARINGYDGIPSILPTPPGGAGLTHAQRVRRTVANVLATQGLSEIWSAPFVGADRYAALGLDVDAEVARSVRLANPLSDEQPLMRTRLLATMVDGLRRNVARGARDVALFEFGLVVDLDGPQRNAPTEDVGVLPTEETLAAIRAAVPPQPRHVGWLLAGDRDRHGWWGEGRPADVTDAIDLARVVGESLAVTLHVVADTVAPYHPGRCARVELADGSVVGHVGELHPKVVAALGLPPRTVGAELDLDVLTRAAEVTVQASTLTAFPMAQSDVALVVDEGVTAAAVEEALREGAGETLESVNLFDVYRGDQLEPGKKSLAYRLTFRAEDRTLTTDEVSALRDSAVKAAASRTGAVQR
ncbi:phenylalanyl-tRNA synthetase subunit beta [Knoellia sinensis KCTC 19936]|uniref:Phenylalanine--tRNA ligase beta subunit n=1 Tax=Knoellia sinensis KCTC 19936 TaxID=1385520 RepID=A0A0A0JAY6_9MICO|nr:phenylalanine--tRNA ligase subunit beta [Knoellia sinensis]KGN34540.1 phenylalanyl-tRNA synthetase subunit beta [Knoellia sinensis KCTC 19936]